MWPPIHWLGLRDWWGRTGGAHLVGDRSAKRVFVFGHLGQERAGLIGERELAPIRHALAPPIGEGEIVAPVGHTKIITVVGDAGGVTGLGGSHQHGAGRIGDGPIELVGEKPGGQRERPGVGRGVGERARRGVVGGKIVAAIEQRYLKV